MRRWLVPEIQPRRRWDVASVLIAGGAGMLLVLVLARVVEAAPIGLVFVGHLFIGLAVAYLFAALWAKQTTRADVVASVVALAAVAGVLDGVLLIDGVLTTLREDGAPDVMASLMLGLVVTLPTAFALVGLHRIAR